MKRSRRVSYPKVRTVAPLPGKNLLVTFSTGETKRYDCKPLLKEPVFSPLRNQALFETVHPGEGGYGVIWNDDLDLSESELWIHGKTAKRIPLKDSFWPKLGL